MLAHSCEPASSYQPQLMRHLAPRSKLHMLGSIMQEEATFLEEHGISQIHLSQSTVPSYTE